MVRIASDEMNLSLDRRVFGPAANSAAGEVDAGTRFTFREEGGVVWAEYAGGGIERGFLVGTRSGAELAMRYVQLNSEGETSAGRSIDRIERLGDGRMRLHETWTWESRAGSGTSVLEEIRDGSAEPGPGADP